MNMRTHSEKEADRLRQEQLEEGRRLATETETELPRRTLTAVSGFASKRPISSGVKTQQGANKVPLKGHEAFIKALELSHAQVRIEKVSSGEVIIGEIKHSDKFSVTINAPGPGDEKPRDRVIFKHDISEFSAMTPKAAE